MISFYSKALENDEFPRDFPEILHLSLVFLRGAPVKSIQFRAPGALHHARWMVKAIFCLKIYLFRKQIKVSTKEQDALFNICQFVALLYAKYWHEAPLATKAPRNDQAFISHLMQFPNRLVADVALKAIKRHL